MQTNFQVEQCFIKNGIDAINIYKCHIHIMVEKIIDNLSVDSIRDTISYETTIPSWMTNHLTDALLARLDCSENDIQIDYLLDNTVLVTLLPNTVTTIKRTVKEVCDMVDFIVDNAIETTEIPYDEQLIWLLPFVRKLYFSKSTWANKSLDITHRIDNGTCLLVVTIDVAKLLNSVEF